MIFDVEPMGKPRQTQRDRWKKRPAVLRYHAYRDAVRARSAPSGWEPKPGDHIIFRVKMPKSWSKKKRLSMIFQPHEQKPDLDNMIKAFLDCWEEDKHIWAISAEKRWGVMPSIEVKRGRLDLLEEFP